MTTISHAALTTSLLFTIATFAALSAGFLAVGLVAVQPVLSHASGVRMLCEIRDAMAQSCEYVRRVADAMAEDDMGWTVEDEWSVVRGNPPFGGKQT